MNKTLRNLLNDLFQDADPSSQISADLANAIVSVHLAKFEEFISQALQKRDEEILEWVSKRQRWLGSDPQTSLSELKDYLFPSTDKDFLNQGRESK